MKRRPLMPHERETPLRRLKTARSTREHSAFPVKVRGNVEDEPNSRRSLERHIGQVTISGFLPMWIPRSDDRVELLGKLRVRTTDAPR